MAFRVGLPNFSKGEIAPEVQARTDVAAYGAAVKRAENVIILKYGGLTKRPGTRLVAEVYDRTGEPVRLIPFQFNDEQSYALEFGQGYMRPAAGGGMVLNDPRAVTAITKAATAAVAVAFHGYSVGDEVFFQGIQGMDEINGRIGRVLTVPDAGHFTVDIDTTGFGAFTGSSGGATNSGPPAPDPTPPSVPPAVPPSEPPPVGGGGGGGGALPPLRPGENYP